MKRTNIILSALIVGTLSCGAIWEFRDLQPANGTGEKQVVFQEAADPIVHKTVRVCTETGEPVPDLLVEAIILRGASEIKVDTCTTDNNGMCVLDIPRGSNGRIQVMSSKPEMVIVPKGESPLYTTCSQPG